MSFLKGLGVTHIVNATSEVRNYFEKEPGFFYLNTPCMDTDAADLSPFFDSAVTFIHDARKEGHSVLVHCQQGVSRSAAIVLAYLVKAEGRTLNEAYTLLRNKRSTCKVRPNFLKQLVTWEMGLKPQKSGSSDEKRAESVKRKDPDASPSLDPDAVNATSAEGSALPSQQLKATQKGPQLPPPKGPQKGPQLPSAKGPQLPQAKGPQLPPAKAQKGPQLPPPPETEPTEPVLDEKAAFFGNRKAKSFGSGLPF
jgi:protein-tyrosine phosphatase